MQYIASMPKEMGEKWVNALRSGKYNQSTSMLKTADGYCCLGVFAECEGILAENGLDMTRKGMRCGYEPLEMIIGEGAVSRLWRMNDSEGKSFSEIADWIENNIEFT